jgi:transcriptional regulator with XRE-family HTH domain
MATADIRPGTIPESAVAPRLSTPTGPQLHRVRTVRLQQGVSLRSASRQLGISVSNLRMQEHEATDLHISELRKWQKVLEVPLVELVAETDEPLSRPVLERAHMIRVMKTVRAIQEQAPSPRIERLANMLVEQLAQVMPELRDVSAWHQFGQRRSADEIGRVAERSVADLLEFAGDD